MSHHVGCWRNVWICRIKWLLQHRGVAQQHIKFDENEFANCHVTWSNRQRIEERAGARILRTVLVEGIEKQVGVERNHCRSGGIFVREQSPLFHRRTELTKVARSRKLPLAGIFRVWLMLLKHHLLHCLAHQFGHSRVQLPSQSFNLLVQRVGQLNLGFFHAATLLEIEECVQSEECSGG